MLPIRTQFSEAWQAANEAFPTKSASDSVSARSVPFVGAADSNYIAVTNLKTTTYRGLTSSFSNPDHVLAQPRVRFED